MVQQSANIRRNGCPCPTIDLQNVELATLESQAKKLTEEKHYSTTFYLDYKPTEIIQTEPLSRP